MVVAIAFAASAVVVFAGWRFSARRSALRLSQGHHERRNPLFLAPDIAPHNEPWQSSPSGTRSAPWSQQVTAPGPRIRGYDGH
jgi:hypothetical protein